MAQDHSPSPERRRSERATAKAARQSALSKAAKSARRKKGRDGKLNYFINPLQLTSYEKGIKIIPQLLISKFERSIFFYEIYRNKMFQSFPSHKSVSCHITNTKTLF